jgi:hypothetical protein
MHPDGSFGGVYGSRNTRLFFPHGFELLGSHIPEATWMAEHYLQGVNAGRQVFLDDDRLIGHLTYNHLQAFLDYHERPSTLAAPAASTRLLPQAGLYVRRHEALYAVLSLRKGGVFLLFQGKQLQYADSGLIASQQDGRCLVSHLIDHYEYEIQEHCVRVKGHFGYATARLPTPLTMSLFHLGMVTVGRFCSNMIRALLQKVLIVGKKPAPLLFQRTVQFSPQVVITDELWDRRRQRDGQHRLTSLYTGTDHTSIYVAMSNAYQAGSLLPWTDHTEALDDLRTHGYVKIERTLTTAAQPAE